jgi:hypothetical protein
VAAAALAACAALAGCSSCRTEEPGPLADAEATAVALFSLAAAGDDDPSRIAEVVQEDLAASHRVPLLEALDGFRAVTDVRARGAEPLDALDRVTVDVEGTLPGDAVAFYAVQVARVPDGTWRVVWFAGPGVEWPPGKGGSNGSLSSSRPPDE